MIWDAHTTSKLLAGDVFFATIGALRLADPAERLEMVDANLVDWTVLANRSQIRRGSPSGKGYEGLD